jgi:hypothetical protein
MTQLRSVLLILLVTLFSAFGLSACNLPWNQAFSGLSVQAEDGASFQVYLDDIHLGQTPIQRSDLKPGSYRLKLDPGNGTTLYEGTIRLHKGTVSTVLWSFAGTQPTGTGQILELEPLPSKSRAELSVITVPEGSTVQLNNTTYGLSPVILDEAEAGQYSLTLNAVGHVKKTIAVRIEEGHRLHVFSRLERSADSLSSPLPATGSADTAATDSALLAPPTTSPKASASPSPTPKASTTGTTTTTPGTLTPPYLTVKETGTGWLRVRETPSATATELAKVDVGTKHSVEKVQNGWYEIEYETGKTGWVSGQYVEYVAE